MRKFVFALVAMAAAAPALARDDQGNATVLGIGNKSCADYLAADATARAEFKVWTEGYISAANFIAPGVANVLGTASIDDAILMTMGFCDAERDKTWAQALNKAIDELIDAAERP